MSEYQGLTNPRPQTKKLMTRQLATYHRRRKEWFDINGPCSKCSSWENLEVDHIDPLNKIAHKIWQWSKERREEELAKCQVLCKVCHRQKTSTLQHELFTKPIQHGTFNGYTTKKCRCDECRKANAFHARQYKKLDVHTKATRGVNQG